MRSQQLVRTMRSLSQTTWSSHSTCSRHREASRRRHDHKRRREPLVTTSAAHWTKHRCCRRSPTLRSSNIESACCAYTSSRKRLQLLLQVPRVNVRQVRQLQKSLARAIFIQRRGTSFTMNHNDMECHRLYYVLGIPSILINIRNLLVPRI
jgi:hypothetical protein